MSQIDNDNVHQGSKTILGDDNIHLSLCVVGGKVRNFFVYMSSIFQCDNCNGILKHIMGCNAFNPAWAMEQMDTQIIDGMTTLAL
jgi:hypothetical protein